MSTDDGYEDDGCCDDPPWWLWAVGFVCLAAVLISVALSGESAPDPPYLNCIDRGNPVEVCTPLLQETSAPR